MIIVELLHPRATLDHVGLLPNMLSTDDPRPAREQFDANYRHGGGWQPQSGFTLTGNNSLKYPGDPPFHPLARIQLRDEQINIYEYGYVAIIQPNRSFEVCRMD